MWGLEGLGSDMGLGCNTCDVGDPGYRVVPCSLRSIQLGFLFWLARVNITSLGNDMSIYIYDNSRSTYRGVDFPIAYMISPPRLMWTFGVGAEMKYLTTRAAIIDSSSFEVPSRKFPKAKSSRSRKAEHVQTVAGWTRADKKAGRLPLWP